MGPFSKLIYDQIDCFPVAAGENEGIPRHACTPARKWRGGALVGSVLVVFTVLLVVTVGCSSQQSQPPGEVAKNGQPVRASQRVDPLEVVQALRAVGAQLVANDAGNVVQIDLSSGDASDATLAELPKLVALKKLRLFGPGFTDAGVAGLSALGALQSLTLEKTDVTDEALVQLAKMRGLRELKLPYAAITDSGLQALQDLSQLRSLQLLPTGPGRSTAKVTPTPSTRTTTSRRIRPRSTTSASTASRSR